MTSSAAPTGILIMTIVLGPLLVRTRIILAATTIRGIDAVFSTMVREKVDALCVAPGTLFNARRVQLAVLAARHDGVPAVYAGRDYVVEGGLMSYGSNVTLMPRCAAEGLDSEVSTLPRYLAPPPIVRWLKAIFFQRVAGRARLCGS